jgi:hypothetical protein
MDVLNAGAGDDTITINASNIVLLPNTLRILVLVAKSMNRDSDVNEVSYLLIMFILTLAPSYTAKRNYTIQYL